MQVRGCVQMEAGEGQCAGGDTLQKIWCWRGGDGTVWCWRGGDGTVVGAVMALSGVGGAVVDCLVLEGR